MLELISGDDSILVLTKKEPATIPTSTPPQGFVTPEPAEAEMDEEDLFAQDDLDNTFGVEELPEEFAESLKNEDREPEDSPFQEVAAIDSKPFTFGNVVEPEVIEPEVIEESTAVEAVEAIEIAEVVEEPKVSSEPEVTETFSSDEFDFDSGLGTTSTTSDDFDDTFDFEF